jgi:hypothetical protein
MEQILMTYSNLLKTKKKNLTENTYIGLVELFMRNGYLDYASFFLCKMDRLGVKIPRKLLDLFLDYSINNQLFEKKEEIAFKGNSNTKAKDEEYNYNKFDEYDDPDYSYYFKNRNKYKKINDINSLFKELKVDAAPYFPKKNDLEQLKEKISTLDPNKVKEYVPKNYKVVKKEDI